MTTHALFIIDGSGSMFTLAEDVRGGFNGWLQQAVADGRDYRMTVTTFNTEVNHLYENVPVAQADRLHAGNYAPTGCTALWDAVGQTLTRFRDHVTLAADDKVFVQIETDGLENASREYNPASIRTLVEELKAKGWAFVFAGTGLNDWRDAQASGLGLSTSSNAASPRGTTSRYAATYAAVVDYFAGELPADQVSLAVQDGIDKRGGNDPTTT